MTKNLYDDDDNLDISISLRLRCGYEIIVISHIFYSLNAYKLKNINIRKISEKKLNYMSFVFFKSVCVNHRFFHYMCYSGIWYVK